MCYRKRNRLKNKAKQNKMGGGILLGMGRGEKTIHRENKERGTQMLRVFVNSQGHRLLYIYFKIGMYLQLSICSLNEDI